VAKKSKKTLAETHPDIAREADGWDPSRIFAGSHSKRKWKCQRGHSWEASPNSRTHLKRPTGCPYCAGKRVWDGFNDLLTTHPETAKLADGWDPRSVGSGSGIQRSWKCSIGHTWSAAPHDQIKNQSRCAYCTGALAWPGFNDLQTTHPEVASQLVDGNPTKIRAGSGKKFTWRCSLGHQWRTSPNERVKLRGCPFCSGKQIQIGFNDLATTHPDIARELLNRDPQTVSRGTNTYFEWQCDLGHQWRSSPNQRTSGYGCPYCSGRLVWPGFNDLQTTHPDIARELVNGDPTKISQGSMESHTWQCELGHQWKARPNSRTANQSGCPTCSKSGFDPNSEGWLYFLNHSDWKMLQIGITNKPKVRLKTHSKLGWELIELRGPMDGHLVQQWETVILRYIKTNGGKMADKIGLEPFDGYSESWLKESFTFSSLKEIMALVDNEEQGD
jgi:hypothetical protein